jgi:lipopolysaccharide/colanic/teichoic acid biosynthesis glycosyltransferase
LKRVLDFILSLIGIILLIPLFLLISFFIVFDSKGGVFYLQERIGLNGKPFMLIKFRTMRKGSDKKGLLTIGEKDSRVTKFGYFLRKHKLDELPQLFNVFIGQMSFVGPRPEVAKYVALYNEKQKLVLSVRPGITDRASILYFSESEKLAKSSDPEKTYIEEIMPVKLKINLEYINNRSVSKDFKLMFSTFFKIIDKV